MRQARSLKNQLTLALCLVFGLCLLTIIGGTAGFIYYGYQEFLDSLSEPAREAYLLDWSVTGMPDAELVKEITLAEETVLAYY